MEDYKELNRKELNEEQKKVLKEVDGMAREFQSAFEIPLEELMLSARQFDQIKDDEKQYKYLKLGNIKLFRIR